MYALYLIGIYYHFLLYFFVFLYIIEKVTDDKGRHDFFRGCTLWKQKELNDTIQCRTSRSRR